MSAPLPASASVVVVWGYWWNTDGDGVERRVRTRPTTSHVTSTNGFGVIDLETKTAVPEADDPYWEIELVASNDPDLRPEFAWVFEFDGYDGEWTVTVPHDAAVDGTGRRRVALTSLTPLVSPPSPAAGHYTAAQVDQKIQAAITAHLGMTTPGWDPHPQYRLDV